MISKYQHNEFFIQRLVSITSKIYSNHINIKQIETILVYYQVSLSRVSRYLWEDTLMQQNHYP